MITAWSASRVASVMAASACSEGHTKTIIFSTLLPRHAETSAACRGNRGTERDHFALAGKVVVTV
jgi:hypothetical protein